MQPESIAFLDANRHHYDLLMKAGYVKQLDGATIQGLLSVVRKEWNGGYLINTWCGECVVNMIKFAYTQYDKWIENNKTQTQ